MKYTKCNYIVIWELDFLSFMIDDIKMINQNLKHEAIQKN